MTVLWAIIWTLLGLFILLSVLLLVPVSFSAQAGLEETASFEAVLAWAGGLASFQATAAGGLPLEMSLRLGRWTRRLQPGASQKQESDARRGASKKRRGTAKRFELSWIDKVSPYLEKQVLKEVFRYLLLMERSLDLELSFAGEVGFDDPELTGYLAGLLASLNAGQWECDLRPNFTEAVLRFRGTVRGRAMPAQLLCLTGRLLLSTPARSIWWPLLRKPQNKSAKPIVEHAQQ